MKNKNYMIIARDAEKDLSQVPVADACNLSYSGGRDQEDH
jgi:hypothetical protein